MYDGLFIISGGNMIQEHAADLAAEMGIQLSWASFVEGRPVAGVDEFVLSLESEGHQVSTLVHKSELDGLTNRTDRGQLDDKIRSALSRLKLLLEP
jgi:hypothetical protein